MTIHRLLYRSDIALVGSDRDVECEVREIVAISAAANAKAGLTGALSFTSGVFVQALEGEADAIETTFERICRDLRHKSVRLLEFAPAEERVFPEWTMARVGGSMGEVVFQPLLGGIGTDCVETAPPSTIVALLRSLILCGSGSRSGGTLGAAGASNIPQASRIPSST